MNKSVAAVAVAAASLTACVLYEPRIEPMAMPWGQTVVVSCRNDKSMSIDFIPSPRAARVRFDDSTVTLPQVEGASDAKFSDGRYTLYINDSRAALEETGVVVRGPCAPR